MKIILSVIAICLVMITVKLYTPNAVARVAGMDWLALTLDNDFAWAVEDIIEDCSVEGSAIDC